MQWADVVKPPSNRVLRQFAGLWLVFFLGIAASRWWHGQHGLWTVVLAIAAVVVGIAGMAVPAVVRPIFTGWMIAAFPIGWTVSRVVLGFVFFLIVTPIALIFRLMGRDILRRRRPAVSSYWSEKTQSSSSADYLRQI